MTTYDSPGSKRDIARRRASLRRICIRYGTQNAMEATMRLLDDMQHRIDAAKAAKAAGLPNPNL